MPAYYVVRRGGLVAFTFDTISLPVRRRPETRTAKLPFLFEINPHFYEPSAPYARDYDLALIKTVPRHGGDPRYEVFGGARLPILAQQGDWWLVETQPPK